MKSVCPLCRKATVKEWRPFCSRYCKNIDLKRWLNEEYVVPDANKSSPGVEDAPDKADI